MPPKKWFVPVVCLLLVAAVAVAGPGEHEDMMTQFMNCDVCKNLAVHMQELAPVMKNECIALNDGMAMHHWVTDPAKAALFHEASAKMAEAGAACMSYTADEAKERLCDCCQGIHGLMAAGATMSMGQSDNGDLMVITSSDPAVQTQIAAFNAKMKEMMATMGT
jgi:hypothetical protein